ncbi:MAG: Histidyl-tRNA synthetase [candidate division WS6 bacterium GW2011_GWA2_37_6]|uniref:Histidine--tRNA ligase n=1 Tax=candidate division WS6 bacterium GW2011_GWA2_37_6 TaxID=1619087 RepID=A0A0G0H7G6_9BACT|nr:MAG: Histidyl-tRNA synthetase [candidate division WS6 bacterium GW2011_GWA2_37_6]
MAILQARLESLQHIVLRTLMKNYSAKQVGVQKYEDKIRLDVKSDVDLTQIDKKEFELNVNNVINRKLDVSNKTYPINELPEGIDISLLRGKQMNEVRVVSIGDFDSEPCDDVHVSNTSEIGQYKLLSIEKVGKDTYRFMNSVQGLGDAESKDVPQKIEPRLLKGFRDFLPEELKLRKKVFAIFEKIFEKYGYEPLETPILEYFDILMGKYGEEEKLVYKFEDSGGRKVAMKYDLTVPTARVLAQYQDKIKLPFKRYQIQPVWRADNTQKGRFREFYQCDADCLGTASMTADAEFISMAIEILEKLGFKEFLVRINNRKILNAISKYAEAEDKFYEIVYAIDKWDKRTPAATKDDLIAKGLSDAQVEKVFSCINLLGTTSMEKLNDLEKKLGSIPEGKEGINELREIIGLVNNEVILKYDPTIARGLTYYTGPVWEITVIEGGVGSVAGCGRYDKLVGSYLGRDIPATGGSFGIERIIEVMKDRGMALNDQSEEQEKIMVANMEGFTKEAFDLAAKLRAEGKIVFLYPEAKKLGKQLEFADKKGFDKVYILGENEINAGGAPQVKEMKR